MPRSADHSGKRKIHFKNAKPLVDKRVKTEEEKMNEERAALDQMDADFAAKLRVILQEYEAVPPWKCGGLINLCSVALGQYDDGESLN